jgi:hypothetical protein
VRAFLEEGQKYWGMFIILILMISSFFWDFACLGWHPLSGQSHFDSQKREEYAHLIELETQSCIPQGSINMCERITDRINHLTDRSTP